MKFYFFAFIFLSASSAYCFDSSCRILNGTYKSVDNKHSSLQLEVGDTGETLHLVYDQNDPTRHYRLEDYLLDGSTHLGDGVLTGETYSAFCENGVLTIIRNFARFKGPLCTTLVMEKSELVERATMEGVPGWSIELGRFSR